MTTPPPKTPRPFPPKRPAHVASFYPPEELERRRVARIERRKAARWILALAYCGLDVRQIGHVLGVRDLSLVRQPLYSFGHLHYDDVRRPEYFEEDFKALWADTDIDMPPALRAILEKKLKALGE